MALESTVQLQQNDGNKTPEKPVDREKTCPLLLRVFYNTGRHNPLNELDATLKELTSLVKEVNPDARRKGTFFDFSIVYPDSRSPTYRMREIGTTCSGHRGADDTVSLQAKRFVIGDYIDIGITPPGPRGPLRPGNMGRRGRPY
ncbi:SAP18-like protein [Mya arenaria]|uniref:18 kDa Sin3-associated polypeptide n=1 Tax=Mya arenaria TaxID=6604 RepID=A0ABY7EJC4_MYAAR|nr:SAP18-like protein [Mya arenaria]